MLLGVSILIADFTYKGVCNIMEYISISADRKMFCKTAIIGDNMETIALFLSMIIDEHFHGHFEMIKAQLFYELGYKMAVLCMWLKEGVEAWVEVVRALIFGWRSVISRKILFTTTPVRTRSPVNRVRKRICFVRSKFT